MTQSFSERLAKAMPPILKAALEADGWQVTIGAAGITATRGYERLVWAAGKGLTISARSKASTDEIAGQVQRAYAKAAVSWAAQRAGWTTTTTGANTLTVTRR